MLRHQPGAPGRYRQSGKKHLTLFYPPLTVDADAVLLSQGADPLVIRARRPHLVSLAEQAAREGALLAEPYVEWAVKNVRRFQHQSLELEGGGVLSGELIASQLAGARQVILGVATLGFRIEETIRELMISDPPLGLALDGYGTAGVDELVAWACRRADDIASQSRWNASIPISPGLIGWELGAGQAQLFGILKPDETRVRLMSSGQMTPRKSTTFVIGLGEAIETGVSPCAFCSVSESCRYKGSGHQNIKT